MNGTMVDDPAARLSSSRMMMPNVETLLTYDKEDATLRLRSVVVEVRVEDEVKEEEGKGSADRRSDDPPHLLEAPISTAESSSMDDHRQQPQHPDELMGGTAPKVPSTLATLTTAGTGASLESSENDDDDESSSRAQNVGNITNSSSNSSPRGDDCNPTGTDDSYFGSLLGFTSSSASLASSSASSKTKRRKAKKKKQISQSSDAGDENDDYDDDDDNRSVDSSASSAAYFEPSDLNPGYWARVMGNHAPTFALTLVALSAAVLHPILFVAGTLAAFGTYTAAAAASSSHLGPYDALCLRHAKPESTKDDQDTAPPVSSVFCLNTSDTTSTTNDYTSTTLTNSAPPPLLEPLSDSEASESTAPVQEEETALPHLAGTLPAPEHPDGAVETLNEAATKGRVVTSSEVQQRDFVESTYPALEHPILKDQVFYGLSALETFKIFFDDHAPYNFIEFQKNRGDVDITYRPWQPVAAEPGADGDATCEIPCPTSLMSPRSAPRGDVPPVLAYQERVVTFKAKTNAIFGPAYAPTTKTQRFVLLSKRWAVLESRTELSDIPFADRFYVMERWIVHATKTPHDEDPVGTDDPLSPISSGGPSPPSYVCRISISSQVVFKKPCGALENQIRSKAYSTLLEVATAWCCMAREALNLAEMARLNRLRHHPEPPAPVYGGDPSRAVPMDEILVDESVEVEHGHADDPAAGADGEVTLRRSESEPALYHHSTQPRFHNLRQSIINFSVRKPSFEFRRPRKGTAAW